MPSPQPIAIAITLAKPGGATSFVFQFAQWLHARGEAVVVLMGEEGDWLETHCREAHIPYRRVPHLRRAIHPVHDLLALRAFREVLRDIRPRAIHLNSSKAGVIGSLAARSLSLTPIVYCIAGWAVLDSSSWWQRFAYFWPERLTAWAKDEIVCLHPGDEQYAKRHGIIPRQGLTVIPNGIDVDTVRADLFSRQKARDELGLPHEDRKSVV